MAALSLNAFGVETEPNDFVTPRIITVIRNGVKPRKVVRLLLNKRTSPSFSQVIAELTAAVKLDSGMVRKVFTLMGRPVCCTQCQLMRPLVTCVCVCARAALKSMQGVQLGALANTHSHRLDVMISTHNLMAKCVAFVVRCKSIQLLCAVGVV
jgi:hypothetical protein